MKTISTIGAIPTNSLLPILLLFCMMISVRSNGQQYTINQDALPIDYTPYLRNGTFKNMHDVVSKSLVMLRRQGVRYDGSVGYYAGTAYFIKTDPDKEYYCLLTAGHNLFDGIDVDRSNEVYGLDFAYQPIFFTDAASRLGGYGNYSVAWADRQDPRMQFYSNNVTVVKARVAGNKHDDWTDFALLKLDKDDLPPGIDLVQLGYEFKDEFPVSRLKDDPYKTGFVLHHSLYWPTLFSYITASDYKNQFKDPSPRNVPNTFSTMFNFKRVKGKMTTGASGSPLVIPYSTSNNDGSAIGIHVGVGGDLGLPDDETELAFYKLSNIKSLIRKHCFKSEDEEENKGSSSETTKIVISRADAAIKVAKNVLNSMKTTIKNLAPNVVRPLSSQNEQESVDAIANKSKEALEILDNLSDAVANRKPLKKIHQLFDEYDLKTLDLQKMLQQTTLDDIGRGDTVYDPEKIAQLMKTLEHVGGSFDDVETDKVIGTFYVKDLLTQYVPVAFQFILSKLNIQKFVIGRTLGRILQPQPVVRDTPFYQMQAPEELSAIRQKVRTVLNEMNSVLADFPSYKTKNKYLYDGSLEYYYYLPQFSNSFLTKKYYSLEISLTKGLLKTISDELSNLYFQNLQHFRDFESNGRGRLINHCTLLNQQLNADLESFEQLNYPEGFVKQIDSNAGFSTSYSHFVGSSTSSRKITDPLDNLTWKSFGLTEGAKMSPFPYKDLKAPVEVKRKDVIGDDDVNVPYDPKGDIQEYLKLFFTRQSFYSSNLQVGGELDLEKVRFTYHPYLANYLKVNSQSIQKEVFFDWKGVQPSVTLKQVFDDMKPQPKKVNLWKEANPDVSTYLKSVSTPLQLEKVSSIVPNKYYINAFTIYEDLVFQRSVLEEAWDNKYTDEVLYKTDQDYQSIPNVKEDFQTIESALKNNLQITYRLTLGTNWSYEPWVYTQTLSPVQSPSKTSSRQPAVTTVKVKERVDAEKVILYPNPVKDQLFLKGLTLTSLQTVNISDISGKAFQLPVQSQGTDQKVDVQSLPAGLYFLKVQPENQPQQVLKFVKD
ncbi:T9SS type A sorting domain-containing protein [Larkinella rosea]|uniref:T9SS C-terminal target domain-containing protein n=1 Tax=Larkinella rosea TaxID=2025312 RepID=A0A3P1BJG7_9BACT|nr:T9SS type A sorting domain-containing protein [Larkinella rosea]RRB01155.1 T9SS C-terminal target domain-containing protein [Larkinella rosea]